MKEINKKTNLCSINNVKGWTEAKKTKGSQICGCHCILCSLYWQVTAYSTHTRPNPARWCMENLWRQSDSWGNRRLFCSPRSERSGSEAHRSHQGRSPWLRRALHRVCSGHHLGELTATKQEQENVEMGRASKIIRSSSFVLINLLM